jgi:predicted small metal-binding protein
MKCIICNDIGNADCNHRVEAETDEEVKKMLFDHKEKEHSEKQESMSEEEKAAIEKKMDEILLKQ